MTERTRDDLRRAAVQAARAWIGTPYQHQASVLGAGCDCLGLVRGIWRALHGPEVRAIPAYGPDWSETSGDEALWAALAQHLTPTPDAMQPGQVLLFRMRAGSVAKHLGILSDAGASPKFIHAYSGHGVVESPLSPPWARRVVARFDLS
ncbi:NlpC/P60 family protein [Pararhodobacter sp.]|uniref:NlpC/P60 family protein n=1 Tax=Pararhodobacter sp. TaxID=2127056 RepID=UPI002AFEDC7B|nr:NlpC/P60 family protein [Pararhodobacter sp.]